MIVYTPVDIQCIVPDQEELKKFLMENHMSNLKEITGYSNLLCAVAFRSKITNWRDAEEIFLKTDINANPDQELIYAPGVPKELKNILESLPYEKITGAWLNLHLETLDAHQDDPLDFSHPMSPERYNVLLTPHYQQDSFFISKSITSPKKYPVVLKEYPIYAFNNKEIFHGADPVLNNRIIMVCSGIIDHKKHEELISRSAEKFKNYVIRYEDLNVD